MTEPRKTPVWALAISAVAAAYFGYVTLFTETGLAFRILFGLVAILNAAFVVSGLRGRR